MSFYPFVLHEISVLVELILGPVSPTNALGISSLGSGSARPFIPRLPFSRARLYLKPKRAASAHHHLVVEPSPYAKFALRSLAADYPYLCCCYHTLGH
jgi:hypothetical protein